MDAVGMVVNKLVADGPLLRSDQDRGCTAVRTWQLAGPGWKGFLLGHPEEPREILCRLSKPTARVGNTSRLALEHGSSGTAVFKESPHPALERRPVSTRGLPLESLGLVVQHHRAKIKRIWGGRATQECRIASAKAYGMDRNLAIRLRLGP